MKAEIFEYCAWIQDSNSEVIKVQIERLLIKSGFVIAKFTEHHFEPQGYTAVWLLVESHLAIHTFPEERKTYVQLSSCNYHKHEIFCHLLETERCN